MKFKFMVNFSLAVVLMTLLVGVPAFGADIGDPTDTVHAVSPVWKGFSHEDGTGLFFEIIKTVYEPSGIRLKHENFPWKRCIRMIREREADCVPGDFFTENERGEGIYPQYPIYMEITVAVSRKGAVADWKGQESLAGEKCLWLRGYDYQHHLKADADFDEIDSEENALKLIDRGRYKFFLNELSAIRYFMENNSADKSLYDIRPVIERPLYLRFADTDKSRKLIEIYDRRVPEMAASGKMKAIFDKWDADMCPFEPRAVK
jgi:polar amino acid transport system substrate-binding protein